MKLPNLYKNFDVKSNNKEAFYSYEENDDRSSFRREDIIFNEPVIIETKNNTYDTMIVSKLNNRIMTSSKDTIDIDDIKSIKKKR